MRIVLAAVFAALCVVVTGQACVLGAVATDVAGVIGSPFPFDGVANYADNEHCSWLLKSPNGQPIAIEFNHAFLAPGDQVKVYDGATNSAPLLVTQTDYTYYSYSLSSYYPYGTVQSSGDTLFVEWTSNAAGTSTGWIARWQLITLCGGVGAPYNSTSSSVLANGAFNIPMAVGQYQKPATYQNYAICEYNFFAPPQRNWVKITFTSFDIQPSMGCHQDYILFGNADGPDTKLCGNTNPAPLLGYNGPIHDSQLYPYVEFRSDNNGTAAGIQATYEWIAAPVQCAASNTVYGTRSGLISAPLYHDNTTQYGSNLDCGWALAAPAGYQTMQLEFWIIDVEYTSDCSKDYVKIYDGPNDQAPLLATLCGGKLPATYYNTTQPTAYVKFHSDAATNGLGFIMQWRSTTRQCSGNVAMLLDPMAVGMVENPIDYLPMTYTDFQRYESFANCQWSIQAPVGYGLVLDVQRVNLEAGPGCEYDSLKIYDGDAATGTMLDILCGVRNYPQQYLFLTQTATLVFESDYNVTSFGFVAYYSMIADPPLPAAGVNLQMSWVVLSLALMVSLLLNM